MTAECHQESNHKITPMSNVTQMSKWDYFEVGCVTTECQKVGLKLYKVEIWENER
jgi:hypothetical protein